MSAAPWRPSLHPAQVLKHSSINDEATTRIVDQKLEGWHKTHFFMNIRPPVDKVVGEIVAAVRLWYAKQGAPSPAGEGAGAAQLAEGAGAVVGGEGASAQRR